MALLRNGKWGAWETCFEQWSLIHLQCALWHHLVETTHWHSLFFFGQPTKYYPFKRCQVFVDHPVVWWIWYICEATLFWLKVKYVYILLHWLPPVWNNTVHISPTVNAKVSYCNSFRSYCRVCFSLWMNLFPFTTSSIDNFVSPQPKWEHFSSVQK